MISKAKAPHPHNPAHLRQTATLGTLVMEATQPRSLHIPAPDNGNSKQTITTVISVMLRFDPVEDAPPPDIGMLTSTLDLMTFIASQPCLGLLHRASPDHNFAQVMHTEHLRLCSRKTNSTFWSRHTLRDPIDLERHVSGSVAQSSTTTMPASTIGGRKSDYYYLAQLHILIVLPCKKTFVPTFPLLLRKQDLRTRTAPELALCNFFAFN